MKFDTVCSHAPFFKQDQKATVRCVKTFQALCTLWLPWKTQQINGNVCFTNNDKTPQNLPAEAKSGMCKLWCFCSDL